MIVPVLKEIDLIWEPESVDDFVIPASAYIGTADSEGADHFNFRIMTPKRLLTILEEDKFLDGRATFLVNKLDMALLEKQINLILEDCIRPTWDEVANAINRHLNWDYDNIQYETFDKAIKKL